MSRATIHRTTPASSPAASPWGGLQGWPQTIRGVIRLCLAAAALGVLAGATWGALEVSANDWIHYQLFHIAGEEIAHRTFTLVRSLILIALGAYAYWRILLLRRDPTAAERALCLHTALLVAAGVVLSVGFYVNRYAYKGAWKPINAHDVLGFRIPAALVSPEVLLANLGVLVSGALAGAVVFYAFRRLLPWGNRVLSSLSPMYEGALVVFVFAPLALLLGVRASTSAANHPNVVLVSLDTLRADHLGCYGYPVSTSPHIDRWADAGVVFENAISQSNWTLPSHMSLLTAQLPSTHGVQSIRQRLARAKVTLAEVLKNAGYRTAAFTGGYNVDARFGFSQGFDHYEGDSIYHFAMGEKVRYGQGVRFSYVVPRALRWLDREPDRPFFLFLHAWDTHAPYMPHDEHIDRFSREYEGEISLVTHQLVQEINGKERSASRADVNRIRALYDNEIRHVDESFGSFLEGLQSRGLYDKTIIVLTSDHGDELLEHGLGHGISLYEPEIHIPLIMSYPPELPTGGRALTVARSIDIVPTILELANVPLSRSVERQLQGASLVSIGKGRREERVAISEGRASRAITEQRGSELEISLRTSRYKLIVATDEAGVPISQELYDLENDPAESYNLWDEAPELALELSEHLERERQSVSSEVHLTTAEDLAADEGFNERLRALGYLED